MRLNGRRIRHGIDIPSELQWPDIRRCHARIILLPGDKLKQHTHREPDIERTRRIDLIDLLLRQFQPQRLNIPLQMLDLPSPNDREHVRRLVHDVRQRDRRDQRALGRRDLLELLGDPDVCFGRAERLAPFVARALRVALEVAPAQCAPRCECHAFGLRHGQDVALEIARGGGPVALVDGELAEAVVAGIWVVG